jgi:hypothetical protein
MPGGAKPGERRGGRQKGTPNKTTAFRTQVAAAAAAGVASQFPEFDIVEEWKKIYRAFMGQAVGVQGKPAEREFFNARLVDADRVLKHMAPYVLYRKIKLAGDDEHPLRMGPTLNLTILTNEQLLALRPVLELLASQVVDGNGATVES